MNVLLIIVFLILGYLLGKITCNSHFKKSGVWITIAIFIIINGLHSMIDGISLVGLGHVQAISLMIGHELLRQPILYALFLGMIAPFSMKKSMRYLSAFGAVTVVWYITVLIGSRFGQELATLSSFETVVPYLQFLFIGDIIHHVVDWFSHKYGKGHAHL